MILEGVILTGGGEEVDKARVRGGGRRTREEDARGGGGHGGEGGRGRRKTKKSNETQRIHNTNKETNLKVKKTATTKEK